MQHHSDPPEPLPHNEEPQLRKLGLTTTMNRGVPTLQNPHRLCEIGTPLTAEQAQLLKLTGVRMALFRVRLMARWSAADGQVVQVDSEELPSEQNLIGDEGPGHMEDDEMSE
jgi:mRNA turnover protein 4